MVLQLNSYLYRLTTSSLLNYKMMHHWLLATVTGNAEMETSLFAAAELHRLSSKSELIPFLLLRGLDVNLLCFIAAMRISQVIILVM